MPLDSTATGSNQPTYKSIIIRVEKATRHQAGSDGAGNAIGSDLAHKSDVQPDVMS